MLLCVLASAVAAAVCGAGELRLSREDIRRVGDRIFENECASRDEFLLQWNVGEEFLSLGIAHFIWYPAGRRGPFEESFPGFMAFARAAGAKPPAWLAAEPFPSCPWKTRKEFLAKADSRRANELRQFMRSTKQLQAAFVVRRLEDALPSLLAAAPEEERETVERRFRAVASTPAGVYALIDYANFKGLGTHPSERYKGKGWGLLQVLSQMGGAGGGESSLKEFAETAKRLLAERVDNAPRARNERRWLPGWQRRVDSYQAFGRQNV